MRRFTFIVIFLTAITCVAQEAQKQPISPTQRLVAAKTAYIKNGGGNDMPFNIISSGIEGWGKWIPADSAENADIVIEITSYVNDVGSTKELDEKGNEKPHPSVVNIKLVVSDARTHLPLWTGNERPKGAFKQKAVEENIVDASEKLLQRLHDKVEPPVAEESAPEKSK